ncbi:MAG: hypothetical protein QXH65_05930 [Thermofilaceae archaeon]
MNSRRGRASSRGVGEAPVVTIGNLAEFGGYSFAWFADAALRLTMGMVLQDLNARNAPTVLQNLYSRVTLSPAVKSPLASRSPFPLGPRDQSMTLQDALNVISTYIGTQGHGMRALSLPSALSLDFAEHVRIAGGPGRKKRDVFRASEEVIALACIGAQLTFAYIAGGREEGVTEYGYVMVRLHPQLAPLSGRVNSLVRRVTRRLAQANMGFLPILIGASAAVAAKAAGLKVLKSIFKNPTSFEYLRLALSGQKVMAKGFDSIDITGLVKMIGLSGAAGSIVRLLMNCPVEGFNNYRGLVQNLANGLAMYHFYRQPIYLYGALRLLTSAEVQREGSQILKGTWNRVAQRLMNLSRLIT